MAWQPNIPSATDQLSQSQGDLQGNFQELDTYLTTNHVPFGDPDEGKHKWVTFPVQAASPPAGAFVAGEVGLYSFLNPTTANNELYINTQSGTQVPMTARGNQWTYLPSGLLCKWGQTTATGAGQVVSINTGGALGPNFTAVLTIQLTPVYVASNLNSDAYIELVTQTFSSFTVNAKKRLSNASATVTFNWFIIGT
jgi:hypothetical protein